MQDASAKDHSAKLVTHFGTKSPTRQRRKAQTTFFGARATDTRMGSGQIAELKARPLCAGASVELSMRPSRDDVCIELSTIAVILRSALLSRATSLLPLIAPRLRGGLKQTPRSLARARPSPVLAGILISHRCVRVSNFAQTAAVNRRRLRCQGDMMEGSPGGCHWHSRTRWQWR